MLETFDIKKRMMLVQEMIDRQLKVLKVKSEISDMQSEMGHSERESILRQQMRHIREQLGEGGEDEETEELRERLRQAGLSPEAEKIAKKQLSRLGAMHPQSAEWNLARTYLDWLADLPWAKTTPDHIDIREIRRTLDEDHYGLEKVKRRIVEYAAVRQLRKDKKGPILLFVGPPGVGKTSLSIRPYCLGRCQRRGGSARTPKNLCRSPSRANHSRAETCGNTQSCARAR